MRSTSAGLRRRLVRALVLPVAVLLAAGGYVVAGAALAVNTAAQGITQDAPSVSSPWKASYSRQFPGCVASVLWPERATPDAVVVRWDTGAIDRIGIEGSSLRGLTPDAFEQAQIIGACYRR